MIYLASPYSSQYPEVREQRFRDACEAAAALMQRGEFVFSPIAHTHPIARYGLPKGWDFWEPYDREFLDACSGMAVLMIRGWRQSKGVQAEIAVFEEAGKPIEYYRLVKHGFDVYRRMRRVYPNN